MSILLPSSQMPHSLTWLPYEIATIFDASLAPPEPILALIAIRSMHVSMYGLVNTCCQPLESFNLKNNPLPQ